MANNPSKQWNLPPMAVTKVSVTPETHGNSLSVDFCELIVAAFTSKGYRDINAAACLDMKPAAFSKAFRDTDGKYPDQNAIMKRLCQIPDDVVKEFAALLAAKVGLSAGIDAAKVDAAVKFSEAALNLLRVSQR